MKPLQLLLLTALPYLAMAPLAEAHHAFSAEYDANQVVELMGLKVLRYKHQKRGGQHE